ncbi:hypothetical protein M271_38810 [Streptomyces rapamycinicus NRRL 5491]|nr:hypothetical protein M271_38810 [Streptomyces rapamycinicus NRRL 5491]
MRTQPGPEPNEDGTVLLSGDWTGEFWEQHQPIRVPVTLDVDAFLHSSMTKTS